MAGRLLDFALTWAEFELGARRGGIITLTVSPLDPNAAVFYLGQISTNARAAKPSAVQFTEFVALTP